MKSSKWLIRPIVLAVGGCFGSMPAWANPTGPQVMQGNVQIQGLGSNQVKVTNSPNSIIHWQGFSIGAGQVTQFQQQSAASAVLNRVVGPDISSIQGSLLSNGRVFLINPAGIIVGPGGVIDTAGFVGSTLNMLDGDFLAGRLRFQGDAGAGAIVNAGWIKAAQGGNVMLIAPNIENRGVVQTEGGDIVLAAGQKMTIGSPRLEGVQFEVQAPADSAVNVGKLLAEGGAVGVFAGTLKHSGDIRAESLARDEAGRVVLKGRNEVAIAAGGTVSVSGRKAGDVLIQSAAGPARVEGTVTAIGTEGAGGSIAVLGERVSLAGNALIDASGTSGGGRVLVGGDYQGGNAAIQNASNAFVGPDAKLRADATERGDGGRVIVWADRITRFFGKLSARGGAQGGNGGFAEVSGKENLIFAGAANLSAPKGAAGTLLLDPLDLFIDAAGGTGGEVTSLVDEASDVPSNAVTVTPDALANISGNVNLHAGRYMLFRSPLNLTRAGQSLTATVAEWTPTDPAGVFQNQLYIGADITTNGGSVTFTAPQIQTGGGIARTITTSGGAISLTATRGPIGGNLDLNAGTGAVTAFAPKIPIPDTDPQDFIRNPVQLGNVTGGSLNISIAGSISTGMVTTTGPVSLTSADEFVFTNDIISGGGNVAINAAFGIFTGSIVTTGSNPAIGGGVFLTTSNGGVNTNDITAGNGNVTLTGPNGVFTNVIDTTGNVSLLATEGDISATVNNAASLTASATRTDGSSTTVTIEQTTAATPLNANNVSATATGCFDSFDSCASATVDIRATGSVNVGTIAASAPATLEDAATQRNFKEAYVSIRSEQGSIRAMSGASKVTGVDVSLITGSDGNLTPFAGGNVGTAALPLNVDVQRTFTMRAGNEFDVLFSAARPNRLALEVGVAPAGQTFSGNLRHGADVILNASATDATVSLNSLTGTGFDQRVFSNEPFFSFYVPNGALSVPNLTVPQGSANVDDPVSFDVQLGARNDVAVASYTRASAPDSLAKTTSITSDIGAVTINTLNGSKDGVFVTGPAGITISPTTLTTEGNVSLSSNTGTIDIGRIVNGEGGVSAFSNSGNIVVGQITSAGGVGLSTGTGSITINQIDTPGNVTATTTSGNITVNRIDAATNTVDGAGFISLRIFCVENGNCAAGANPTVTATADNTAFEVLSGGDIFVSGHTIGREGFNNPLDLKSGAAGSIQLRSPNAGGRIGFASDTLALDIPMVAETSNLTIVAGRTTGSGTGTAGVGGSFNVSTGAANLQQLRVTANPAGLATAGQASQVRTNAPKTYTFGSSRGNVIIGIPGGAVGASEFTSAEAFFGLDTHEGGIDIIGAANVGNAELSLNARGGSVSTDDITGRAMTFAAGTANDPGRATNVSIVTGALTATEDIRATAGMSSSSGSAPRSGRFESQAILGRDVSITTFGTVAGPAIRIFDGAATSIGSGGTPARDVTLDAQPAIACNPFCNIRSDSGAIEVGNVTGRNIDMRSRDSAYTVGNLSATGTANSTIRLFSDLAMTTGTLDAPVIQILPFFNNGAGAISTGAIGTTVAGRPSLLNLRSSSSITTGAITLDTTVADTVNISGGQVTIGTSGATDALVGGDGSTINVTSGGGNPFTFSRIDAGNTGAVTINSTAGIQQTVNGASDGITARTISLTTGTADAMNARAINNAADAGGLDLRNGTEPVALTLNSGGDVALNANNAVLESFSYTRSAPGAVPARTFVFTPGAAAQTIAIGTAPNDVTLEVNSPTALNFTLSHNSSGPGRGITLAATGIHTSGGNVSLTTSNGPIDASAGGITTGGADGGGSVFLSTSGGALTTGAIDTRPTGTGSSGSITAQTNCASCNIIVNGNLDAGTVDTGSISLSVGANSSIVGDGVSIIRSGTNSVSLTASSGNIGAAATRLMITAPTVTLEARGNPPGAGAGNVFADLTGTNILTLRGDNGFSVTSTVALDRLDLTTRGSGLGTPGTNTLNLTTTGGQTFTFGRADTNMATPEPDQFQVITATGLPRASFTTMDGDVVVGTGASIDPAILTLAAARDLLIRGTITLNNAQSQTFTAGTNLTVQAQGGAIVLNSPSQTFNGGTGNVSFLGGAGADESVTVSAGSSQKVASGVFSTGGLSLVGGAGDRSFVSMSGAGTQTVEVGGSINITGGAAPSTGSYAEIRASSGTQSIRANTNINLTGGQGTNAPARIVNTGAGQQQVGESISGSTFENNSLTLRGGKAGSSAEITSGGRQLIRVENGPLVMQGGDGADAYARIETTGGANQELGTSNTFRIGSIDIEGGSAAGASVEILASGSQAFRVSGLTRLRGGTASGVHALVSAGAAGQTINTGSFEVTGRDVADTYARISSGGSQSLTTSFFGTGALTGGTAPGAFALVDAAGQQSINMSSGTLTLTGGGNADVYARITTPGSQTLSFGQLTLTGGTASGTFARVDAGTDQSLFGGNLTLMGGSGADAFARIDTLGTQFLNTSNIELTGGTAAGTSALVTAGDTQSIFANDITITAAGMPPSGVPAGNAGAGFRGHNQTVNAGVVTINGGTGMSGQASDAGFENFSGDQTFSVNQLSMNGGVQHSRVGIRNLDGAGAQSISSTFGIAMNGAAAGPGSDVVIENLALTDQTISSGSGGIFLSNAGNGTVYIDAASRQKVLASSIEVTTTAAASGSSRIFAADTQYIRTTDNAGPPNVASLFVAASGTGSASIRSNSTQLIEVGYFETVTGNDPAGSFVIGDAAGLGTSFVQGQNQGVFARTLTVQGPNAGTSSKLTGADIQAISVLDGTTSVIGGSGANAIAAIDPNTQTIVANGDFSVTGGSGAGATAAVTSAGTQQIHVTKGQASVAGGSASGTAANIEAAGDQRFAVTGLLSLVSGASGSGASANIFTTSGSQSVAFGSLDLNARAGGAASITSPGAQTLSGGAVAIASNNDAGGARIQAAGDQTISAGALTMSGGANADAFSRITSGGAQTLGFGNMTMTAGSGAGSFVRIDSGAAQTLNAGNITMTANGPGATASIDAAGNQTINAGAVAMNGGAGADASSRIGSGGTQTLGFTGLAMTAGGGAGAFVRIDAPGAQTLNLNGGNLTMTAAGGSALIEAGGNQAISGGGAGTMDGGAATDAFARIKSGGTQALGLTGLAMTAGDGTGSFVSIDSAASQTLNLNGGNLAMTGAGLGASANIQSFGEQTINAGVVAMNGGAGNVASTLIRASEAQMLGFSRLTMTAGSGETSGAEIFSGGAQSLNLNGGNLVMTGAGSNAAARILGRGQTIDAGMVTMNGGAGGNASSDIRSFGSQTLSATGLAMTAGSGLGAFVRVGSSFGDQTLNVHGGNVTLTADGFSATALIEAQIGNQTINNAGAIAMSGGAQVGAYSRIGSTGAQTLQFTGLAMTAGSGTGSFVQIDSGGTQSLTGGASPISLTASAGMGTPASAGSGASIEGHAQTVTCAGCTLQLVGNGANGAQILNLSGAQTVSAGALNLLGGASAATRIRNQGAGSQTVTATAGGILLQSHSNAAANASVAIENTGASAQTLTAAQDTTLFSRGGGTVAVTSGGTQSIDTRGLDVRTDATAPGGANATVQAGGDQSIHTRGSLAAEPGVGMRVASLSSGTAKVVTSGNQTLAIDGNQLLIGRLAFGPPGLPGPNASTQGSPAAGDSLVLATSELANPDQTVTAGSIYIQGPTGDLRVSKLSGDGTQKLTYDRLHLIGGAGLDAFAEIDPTTQTLVGTGNMVIQGGTGENADALINATGPQSVTSQNGTIMLIGGSGRGADALIVTTSPDQSVSARDGVVFVPGPPDGGIAGLRQGSNLAAAQVANRTVTGEIVREQDQFEDLRDEYLSGDHQEQATLDQGGGRPAKASLCN